MMETEDNRATDGAEQDPTSAGPGAEASAADIERKVQEAAEHQAAEAKRQAETEPEAVDEPASGDEREPAVDQAPVAHERQEAIIGDPGFRNESQPLGNEGTPSHVDTPVRTSAPPPEMQSGMPLPEDRAAAAAEE